MKGIRVVCLLVVVALLWGSAVASGIAGPAPESGVEEDRAGLRQASAATAPLVWVEPMTSTVGVGDVFTVEVMKATDEALGLFEFHLSWDPSVLKFLGVDPGAAVEEDATFTGGVRPDATSVAQVTALVLPGATLMEGGSGAMAEVTFEAVDMGSSLVDVIDEEEAEGIPVYEAVALADTDHDRLAETPEVSDGTVIVTAGMKVYLPLILRSH
jgi:hypothetical protein